MFDSVSIGLLGFAAGGLLAALIARVSVRRYLKRQRLAEGRARVAERMAEIGAMTGGLAHEIRNPLSTIGLNAQLLGEMVQEVQLPEDDKRRMLSRLRTLGREVERLTAILSDFLEFAGRVHLDRRPVDVNRLAEELVDFYTPEAERQQIRLRLDRGASTITANIDPKLVKQALLNLVLNAAQAMVPADGRADVPVVGDLLLRVRPGKDASGEDLVEIHVIDTGPGMTPETTDQIFKPYFTTKAGGSGLGLPTARRLIEEHGGRIEVHSEPGRGTDFTVILPLDPVAESAAD